MPSSDNVKSIDQSTTASTGTDPYVSLLKQEMIFNDKFETRTNTEKKI